MKHGPNDDHDLIEGKETGPFKWANQINIWISANGDVYTTVYCCSGAPFMIPIDTNLSPVHLRTNPNKLKCFSQPDWPPLRSLNHFEY